MATAMNIDDFVSVPRAAEIIGCTEGRVRQFIYEGILEGEKHANVWFIPAEKVWEIARKPAKVGRKRNSHK